MSATLARVDDEAGPVVWLTFDEVVARLRFPSRRALFAHLRRHPAPVFQRAGSRRYFMRETDVDRMMAPIDMRIPRGADRDADPDPTYVEVDRPTNVNGSRRRTPRAKPPTKIRR